MRRHGAHCVNCSDTPGGRNTERNSSSVYCSWREGGVPQAGSSISDRSRPSSWLFNLRNGAHTASVHRKSCFSPGRGRGSIGVTPNLLLFCFLIFLWFLLEPKCEVYFSFCGEGQKYVFELSKPPILFSSSYFRFHFEHRGGWGGQGKGR